MPSSRGSSQPRDQTQVSRIAGGFFTSWATNKACPDLIQDLFKGFLFLLKALFCLQVLIWHLVLILISYYFIWSWLKMPSAQFLRKELLQIKLHCSLFSLFLWKGCSLEMGWKSLWPGSSGTKQFPLNRQGLICQLFGLSHLCCNLFENCSLAQKPLGNGVPVF